MIAYDTLGRIEEHPRALARVVVDGVSLADLLRERLIQLVHTDNRGFEADTLDIDLDDSDGLLNLPPKGAIVDLAIGWQASGLVDKGQFTVCEVAHTGTPDVLSIRAASADLAAGLSTQRERSWDSTTLGAIARVVADENGLGVAIHASLDSIAIAHEDQTNESAANFLTRLARRYDAIATVKDGRLLLIPAGGAVSASGKPLPAVTIDRRAGDRHQFLITDRQTYKAVRALYHDLDLAVRGEVVWGDEEDSTERGARPAALLAPAAGQYKALSKSYPTRAKALRAARIEWGKLKANKAQRAAYVGVKARYNDRNLGASGEITYGKADDERKVASARRLAEHDAAAGSEPRNAFERAADNVKTLRHVYASKANAARAARAEWRRLQRGVASFNVTLALGQPEIITEQPATVSGFKPQIDSTDWIVTRVINTLSADGGYTQRLDFEIRATE